MLQAAYVLCWFSLVAQAVGETIEIESALVRPIEHVPVPARERGVLAAVNAREGQVVRRGTLLAQIEDAEAQLEEQRARLVADISRKKSENDIDLQYARKSLEVEKAELRRALESLQKYPQSISESEIDHLQLSVERSALAVQQAEHELDLARAEAQVREREHQIAVQQAERRKIVSPVNGVVVEVKRQAGEWVEPGEPVVRVLGMDRLRVEAFLEVGQASPTLNGASARLIVDLPNRPAAAFAGTVTFVSPEVDPVNGQVRVWVEIANPQLELQPGLRGKLRIQTGTGTGTGRRATN